MKKSSMVSQLKGKIRRTVMNLELAHSKELSNKSKNCEKKSINEDKSFSKEPKNTNPIEIEKDEIPLRN